MATAIEAQPYIDAANCTWCTIPPGMIWYAVLAALIDVGNGDSVPTDPQELISEARCLECTIPQGFVPYAILAAISNISGGGGGAVACGAGVPVAAPSGACALYIDTTDGTLYSYYSGAWH